MEDASVLTLAGLCLGIALTGLSVLVMRRGNLCERYSLALVYIGLSGMIALPIVGTFAERALINYMPLLLVMLLAIPPAFYHHVAAKTATALQSQIPWRDIVAPLLGGIVCIGYWILPARAKETMLISGELPPGFLPALLALFTFGLILIWFVASFAYLVAILRRLSSHRARIRELYSDVEKRDLRWVDMMMGLIIAIWLVGAFSLAVENFLDGAFFVEALFLALIAAALLVLNLFAPITPPKGDFEIADAEPDLKYSRSALTSDHAAKLANRLETLMQEDALYLDPNLSLQKLSQQIGALPNQVSQTLNQEIGSSFFDYVARWRIEASKPLIATGDDSVLNVALDVGFNSRSTFYKAFKRETGMTPKGYRAMNRKAA